MYKPPDLNIIIIFWLSGPFWVLEIGSLRKVLILDILMEVSLKGWDKEDCRDFIIAMERGRSRFMDFQPIARYLLDPIYEYRIGKDNNENITCEILIN